MFVYRSGPLIPRPCMNEAAAVQDLCDQWRPARWPGRRQSFCAAPTLAGVQRWREANQLWYGVAADTAVRMIDVSPATPVYSVHAWEHFCSYRGGDGRVYWDSAIPLAEWHESNFDGGEWELLLTPESVISHHLLTQD